MTITHKCTDCGDEFEIDVEPYVPAKIYGPPEHCHPTEGGEFEPGNCPACGAEVDQEDVYKKMDDEAEAARDKASEDRAERMREEREDREKYPVDTE